MLKDTLGAHARDEADILEFLATQTGI